MSEQFPTDRDSRPEPSTSFDLHSSLPDNAQSQNGSAAGSRWGTAGSLATYLVSALTDRVINRPGDRPKVAREKLRQECAAFFNEAMRRRRREEDDDDQSTIPVRVIRAACGLGKTVTVAHEVNRCAQRHRARILFLAPTYDLLNEIAKHFPDAILLEGRERDGQCLRRDVVKKLMELRAPVQTTLCAQCPFSQECRYQGSLWRIGQAAGGLVVLATHEQLVYLRQWLKFDIVIVDEDCIRVFKERIGFHPDRFAAAARRAPELRADLDRIYEALRSDPENILDALRDRGFRSAEDFNLLDRSLSKLVEADQFQIDPTEQDWNLLRQLENQEVWDTWKVQALVRQLKIEIELDRRSANGVTYAVATQVKINGQPETQERIELFRRQELAVPQDVPMLIIDATADPALLEPIFGSRIDLCDLPAWRNAVFVQAVSAKFDRRSMMAEEGPDSPRYCEHLTKFLRDLDARKPLLITYLDVEEKMRDAGQLPIGCETGHFGRLRGIDAWKSCDTVVVAGRQEPHIEAILGMVRCLFNDDLAPIDGAIQLEDIEVDIGRRKVEATRYPDPRLQAVLWHCREAEICQAVDRLRLINEDVPKLVIILNKVDTGLPIDLALTWPELRKSLSAVTSAVTDQEVVRLTDDYVLDDLKTGHGWSGRSFLGACSQLARAFSTMGEEDYGRLFPNHRLVSYRLCQNGKWRAGKPMRALIRMGLHHPEAEIAKRFRATAESISFSVRLVA